MIGHTNKRLKVSVTGASGFLGGYVCRQLLISGAEVSPFHFSKPLVMQDHDLSSQSLDISIPPEDIFTYLGEPDVLVHLSWAGLPNYRNQDHLEIELPNQISFLRSAIASGVQSVFVAGTCFEYGMQSGMLSEETALIPDNPYGQAKMKLLQSLLAMQQELDFNLTWGRLFYMFGEGQAPNSLWSQFQSTVRNGDLVFNMSGGQQIRDFLPVEEVARLIVELATKQMDYGAVNICTGEPIKVEDIVRRWAEEMEWKGELNLGHYPYPDYEPMAFWGERTKLDFVLCSSQQS